MLISRSCNIVCLFQVGRELQLYFTEVEALLTSAGVVEKKVDLWNLDETSMYLDQNTTTMFAPEDICPHSVAAGKRRNVPLILECHFKRVCLDIEMSLLLSLLLLGRSLMIG